MFGCSSADDDFYPNNSDDFDSQNILTPEEEIPLDTTDYSYYMRSPWSQVSQVSTRATGDQTVYGYTSKSTSDSATYSLPKELKEALGLPRYSYYICEKITANYSITVEGLKDSKYIFMPSNSPNCGLYPGYSDETMLTERGYSSTIKGDNVTMTTKILHIICDPGGILYDIYYPRKPEDLEWVYYVGSR